MASFGQHLTSRALKQLSRSLSTATITTMSATPTQTKQVIKIDMTSDQICPFCPIGLENLLKATKSFDNAEFDIKLHPFKLDCGLTTEPIKKKERYATKFGKERSETILEAMKPKLKAVGIDVGYDGTVSSTHQYHRLIAKATSTSPSTPSAVIPLARDLFRGFFEAQKDPNDLNFLSETAVKHSIFPDVESAMEFFKSGELKEEVETAYKRAQTHGITGVPFFVFEDKYAVSGALSPDEFTQVLQKLIRSPASPTPTIRPGDCVNGKCDAVQGNEICT